MATPIAYPCNTPVLITCECGSIYRGPFGDRRTWKTDHKAHMTGKFTVIILRSTIVPNEDPEDPEDNWKLRAEMPAEFLPYD